jgi:hypothetical protein
MKRIIPACAWAAAMLYSAPRASVLRDLALALPARAFVKLPANASLDVLAMDNSLLYYTDSGVWDPVRKKMAWVGGPGTCCANPAVYKRIAYDEATDHWEIQPTPFSGSGHGYDANAMDPSTGIHYFAFWDDKKIKTWDGQAWGDLPDHPLPANIAVSLSWFPDLRGGKGGLVLVMGSGHMAWFDGAAWKEINGGEAAPWGEYDVFSEYSPALKKMWLGSGEDQPQVHYLLDSQLRLTRLRDAPFSLKDNEALKSADPVGGMFLVYDMAGKAWWEFDAGKDEWNRLSGLKSQPDLGGESLLQVPLPEYGVILIFRHYVTLREIYLYRHSAGTASLRPGPLLRSRPRRASAFVSPRGLRLEVPGTAQDAPDSLRILDLEGRLLARFRDGSRPASFRDPWRTP